MGKGDGGGGGQDGGWRFRGVYVKKVVLEFYTGRGYDVFILCPEA